MHSYGSKSVGTKYTLLLNPYPPATATATPVTPNRSTRNSLPTLNLPGGASSFNGAQTIFIITFAMLDGALLSVRQFDQIAPN